MAIRPDYSVGTISLVASSANFTTTGASLQTAAVQAGDAIITPSGHILIIAAITGQNSGTLFLPCPAGAAGSALPLRIRFQPDGSRYQGAVRNLVDLLGNGVLSNLAELGVEEGKTPVGNASGEYELQDAFSDPNGSLGKLAALTFAARQILQTDQTGALKQVALEANKLLNTDANGDILLSDITQYGRSVLSAANEASARTIIGANRPMFSATASSDISISNGNNTNIPLNNVTVNVGNNWNGTRFLCPEAGNYFFSFIAQWNGGGDNTGYGIARLKKNGAFTGTAVAASKTLFYVPVCVQGILPLAVGDTVNFDFELASASGTIILQTANTRGTGFLIR